MVRYQQLVTCYRERGLETEGLCGKMPTTSDMLQGERARNRGAVW